MAYRVLENLSKPAANPLRPHDNPQIWKPGELVDLLALGYTEDQILLYEQLGVIEAEDASPSAGVVSDENFAAELERQMTEAVKAEVLAEFERIDDEIVNGVDEDTVDDEGDEAPKRKKKG